MQNVTNTSPPTRNQQNRVLQELSKKILLQINHKSIKKAKDALSRNISQNRVRELQSISRNWIKMMFSAQKVDQKVMRRSRTVTFENLTKFVEPGKQKSLRIIKVSTELRQKKSITDEDLEEDLRKSLDFARKESVSEAHGVRISLNLSDHEFEEQPFESEPSSQAPLESDSRESVINKTSIYKIGDHLSDGKREEARGKNHPIKKLKSIEDSKKKKRRSIFYQMSLISQAEMDDNDEQGKAEESTGERSIGSESSKEPTLLIIKKKFRGEEDKEEAPENVFLEEGRGSTDAKGTLEEFQEYLQKMIEQKKRGKKDKIRRYLELQLEIKKKMEELIDEDKKEYPKLIIKKQPKKRKKKKEEMMEKMREEEKREKREKRKKRKKEKRRKSVDKLRKINEFLMKLNMEKKLRKFEKMQREKEFFENLRRERIDEKVAHHRKQMRENKQRQIQKNLKRIENRRKQRENDLRASNNLTRELLLQKKQLNEERRPGNYDWGNLRNEARLKRKDENSSRFFNSSYLKMKEHQVRTRKDKHGVQENASGLARLKSSSPPQKKARGKKKYKSKGVRRPKDHELPEVKTNLREHLRKVKADEGEMGKVEKEREEKRRSGSGRARQREDENPEKENLVDLKNEIEEFNNTFKSSKTDQTKHVYSRKSSKDTLK